MNNWRGILIKECNPKKRGTSFRIYWKCPLRLCLIPNCNFPHHLWAHSPTLSFPLQCAATKAHGHGLYVTTYSTGLLLYSSVADVPSLALCLHFTSFLSLSSSLSPQGSQLCRRKGRLYSSVFTVHTCQDHRLFVLVRSNYLFIWAVLCVF